MTEHGVLPGLWPIHGDGVLARQGDLVLLIHPAGGAFTDRLLDLLTDSARAGQSGLRFTELVSAEFDADAAAADTAADQSGPAVVAFGPAGDGTAVAVYGTAWAEVTTAHGAQRLTTGEPYGRLRCVLPSTLIKVRAGVRSVVGDAETDPYLRLADGVVRAVALLYAPAEVTAKAAGQGPPAAPADGLGPSLAPAAPEPSAQPRRSRCPPRLRPRPNPTRSRFRSLTPTTTPLASNQPYPRRHPRPRARRPHPCPTCLRPWRPRRTRMPPRLRRPRRIRTWPRPRPTRTWPGPPARSRPGRRAAGRPPDAAVPPDFISISLAAPEPGGEVPQRDPLPLGAEPPEAKDLGLVEMPSPIVEGVYCKNGHFNDPEARQCAVCGISIGQLTKKRQQGKRPPLGVLVLSDGSVCQLDADYVIGREPTLDSAVAEGRARPLRLVDASGVVSRIHARVELDGWQVFISDLNSANGTQILLPGERNPTSLQPGVRTLLIAGTQIRLGGEYGLQYDSHRQQ